MDILIIPILLLLVGLLALLYFKGREIIPKSSPLGHLAPHEAARQFFGSIMESQCQSSWLIFSEASRQKFAQWTLEEIYNRNKESAITANLGLSEVELMFENNDSQIMKYFWRRFFFASGAGEIFRFGYFETVQIQDNKAVVKVSLQYPNGQANEIGLPMVKENNAWRLAYVEHNLPF